MKKYLKILLIQIIVIFIVTFVFKNIADRRVAAFIAGLCFMSSSFYYVFVEYKDNVTKWNPVFITSFLFLVLFAIPLFVFRLFQYNVDFANVVVLGIPGPVFHKIANVFYIAMMVATVWNLFLAVKTKKIS